MADTLSRPADVADFTFLIEGLEADTFRVTGFSGSEGMSELYSFQIDLITETREPFFETLGGANLLTKPCALEVTSENGPRFVHGMLRRLERTGDSNRFAHYRAEVVPVFWLLTKRVNSRLFTEANCPGMTVVDIIKKVFTDAGMPSDSFRFATAEDRKAREFCVQYRESEWDFVSRLMEEEGLSYFFEFTATSHKLVIGDWVASVAKEPVGTFPYRDPSGLSNTTEHIYSVRVHEEVDFGTFSVDDFNFKTPGADLETLMETGIARDQKLELRDFPGGYTDRDIGHSYARFRVNERSESRVILSLSGHARNLVPGFNFQLIEHPVELFNSTWLVRRLTHSATQAQSGEEESGDAGAGYEVEIEAGPGFSPLRVTPRPVVEGSQTARVVGPAGEEIYTDEYGRVKVQFHWDREGKHDENSSFWIRVSQGSAGGQYGMMFLPRVGQEVIVDFLEGNPDRPIITGRVYNNDHMPPYKLPDEKTKSTIKTHSSKGGGGTNEIRFEDKKGSEQLLLFAWKELHIRAKGNEMETIGGSRNSIIGGDERIKVGADRHLNIVGDDVIAVSGNRNLGVSGHLEHSVSSNHAVAVGGEYSLSAQTVIIEAQSQISLKVGGNFVDIGPSGVTIQGTMVLINSGGAAGTATHGGQSKQPKDPAAADTVKSGKDVRYTAQGVELPKIEPQTDEEEKTFIEFQLLDIDDTPVANEAFVVKLPDGSEQTGTTTGEGMARFEQVDPGVATISFPNRKNNEWQRLRIVRAEEQA